NRSGVVVKCNAVGRLLSGGATVCFCAGRGPVDDVRGSLETKVGHKGPRTSPHTPGGPVSQRVFNLHNHTPFSDGAYTIDEVCEAHLELRGFAVEGIGISDHLFCTPSSREVRGERDFHKLFAEETRHYVKAVNEARARWANKLQIFCGVEINWPLNKG